MLIVSSHRLHISSPKFAVWFAFPQNLSVKLWIILLHSRVEEELNILVYYVFLLLFWIMPCPENQPGYKIQFKDHSITRNNEQAKVVIYCIPVLNAAISFPCYKVKETMGINDTKKNFYFSCLVLISQARLEHNSKSPLYSPIIGLFWNCFFSFYPKTTWKNFQQKL